MATFPTPPDTLNKEEEGRFRRYLEQELNSLRDFSSGDSGSGGGGDDTWELLAEDTLGSDGSSIDFQSLPDHEVYRIIGVVKVSTDNGAPTFTFNGDTTASYSMNCRVVRGDATTDTTFNETGETEIHPYVTFPTSTTVGVGADAPIFIELFVVNDEGESKVLQGQLRYVSVDGNAVYTQVLGQWDDATEPVDQITFTPSAGNFRTGSHVQVFGRIES